VAAASPLTGFAIASADGGDGNLRDCEKEYVQYKPTTKSRINFFIPYITSLEKLVYFQQSKRFFFIF
jgi:hypothetical protein